MQQLHERHFGATSGEQKKDLAVDFSEVAQTPRAVFVYGTLSNARDRTPTPLAQRMGCMYCFATARFVRVLYFLSATWNEFAKRIAPWH